MVGIYPKGLGTDLSPNAVESFGTRLLMARVEGYDFQEGADGSLSEDENGNLIPTGLLNITVLDHSGSYNKVPYCLPLVGNSQFLGGVPEVGSLCVIGFRPGMRPVILGFMPMGLHRLIQGRSSVPNIERGELLLQSSVTALDYNQEEKVFSGSSIYLDKYGRVIVKAADYELIMGGVLTNAHSPSVSHGIEELTGNPIAVQEIVGGSGFKRVIDSVGNVILRSLKKLVVLFMDSISFETRERFTIKAAKGFSIGNAQRSGLMVDEAGKVTLNSVKGEMEIRSLNNMKVVCNGHKTVRVNGNFNEAVGSGDRNEIVSGNKTESIGKAQTICVTGESKEDFRDKRTVTSKKDWVEKTTDGNRDIDASKSVRIGGPDAIDFLIKGDTYRKDEDEMLSKISTALTDIKTAIGDLRTGLSDTGTALNAISSVYILAATKGSCATVVSDGATAASSCSLSSVGEATSAISTFKGNTTSKHLSPKHKVY